jgi:chitin disaccharide deacetylase
MTLRLIVNADDFGLSSGVNAAVQSAHAAGLLTSATIMANMPSASEAVQIAKQLLSLGVGVHLNLIEGKPVSKADEVSSLLGRDGQFRFSAAGLAIASLRSKAVRRAITIEITSQIQWLCDNGINPTHLDSHRHFHIFPSILPIVTALAERFGLSAVRWPYEPAALCRGPWPSVSAKSKRRALIVRNMARAASQKRYNLFKNDFLFGIAHTGKINAEFWSHLAKSPFDATIELMTHPGFTDGLEPLKTRLIEQRKVELDALCSQDIKEMVSAAKIELTHYGKL